MFKYTSTYEDWNGTKRTEDFYFAITEADMTELEMSEEGGFVAYVTRISKARNSVEAASAFKKLILLSYGEKSEDGRYFNKSDEISKRFTASPVYSELYMRMIKDAKFAVKFFNGILPKHMQKSETELYTTAKGIESDINKAVKEAENPSGIVEVTSEVEDVLPVNSEI